jgi:M6 family metalloprotease-like protein
MAFLVVIGSSAMALQPPDSTELKAMQSDPATFLLRQENAKRFGNHKVSPELAQRTAEKLSILAEGGDPSLLPPPAWRGMPTTGTNSILVFMIDFPDYPAVNSAALISNKVFGAGVPGDFPRESLTKYYERSSYGLLHLKGMTLGFKRMAHNRDWYTTTYGSGNEANVAIIREVAEYFDGTVNYKQFDNNNDGKIDYFAVLWSGPDNGWANFWWGYQWSLFSSNLTLDGVRFYDFSWQWESRSGEQYTPMVLIHETGHGLGLPDYYDYDGNQGPDGGVGGMDMMAGNYGDHNSFSKFMLDWLTPTNITTMAKQLPLRAMTDYPESVSMAKNYAGADPYAEYFMIENRQRVNNDLNLPNSGLVIWHVDARLNGGDFLYNNSYTEHKLLRLMEADGLEEIEKGGGADAGDFYVQGISFSDTTTPNSKFYDGTSSGVSVSQIGTGAIIPADYSLMGNDFIAPSENFISVGEYLVGPFLPSNKTYTVSNPTESNLAWTVSGSSVDWLSFSPSSFDLAPGMSTQVVVTIDQAVALAKDPGAYIEDLLFQNDSPYGSGIRSVILRIGSNYALRPAEYNWIDPVAGGHYTLVAPTGVSDPYDLGFPVTFYDRVYSNIQVSARGLAGFVAEGLDLAANGDFPDPTAPNAMMCPFWDAIDGRLLPARMYFKTVGIPPYRTNVISWVGAPHDDDISATFTLQMIIPEHTNSATANNDIIFQYKDVSEANETYGSGKSATIAIEDEYGAFYRKFSVNGERWLANESAIRFTQAPATDTNPPVGMIRSLGGSGSTAQFEITFNEPVTGLDVGDLVVNSTITGSGLDGITGSGMRYLVGVTNITTLGRISMGVAADAVADWAGNSNAAFGTATYIVQVESTNFFDDMESAPVNWTASTNVYGSLTMNAWQWGTPDYVNGPLGAANGTNCWGTILTNDYPAGMNAWVMSAPINVGGNPVIEFEEWHSFADIADLGYVEVDAGSGWVNVTPGGSYSGNGRSWTHQQVYLDNTMFGNRSIRVRFRAISGFSINSAGMYVDDVVVHSQRAPGVWVVGYTPATSAPATTVPVTVTVYNSSTNTLSNVTADVSSPYSGVSIATSSVPVVYGIMDGGDLRAGVAPVQLVLAAAGNFTTPTIQLLHQSRAGGAALSSDVLPFTVTGVTALLTTNRLSVTSGTGVTNWLGQYLQGNGGLTSCLFQVIAAGSNGLPDQPTTSGQVTGDDRVLYAEVGSLPWGRFGEGASIPPNFGRFLKAFRHGETAGTKVYVRAWDAASFEGSVAYGDSELYTLSAATNQSFNFGTWLVGIPVPAIRDFNGDGISDAYAVTNLMDPRFAIGPLTSSWSLATVPLGTAGSGPGQFAAAPTKVPSPTRLFYKGDYLFVLDTGNNRIQIWNRLTSQYIGAYGAQGSANGFFNRPVGLALDPLTNRFAVADQGNYRIQVFEFDPVVPTNITHVMTFGSAELQKPTDVAIDPYGWYVVADQRLGTVMTISFITNIVFGYIIPVTNYPSVDQSVIELFDPAGTDMGSLATAGRAPGEVRNPGGVCAASDGTIIVADTENNRVQAFDPFGTLLWPTNGTNSVSFLKPRGVQVGLSGRVYVADTDNSQIKILRADGSFIATLGSQGYGFNLVMNHPYGVMPVAESNIVYVADTFNNRVLTIAPIYDGDGDGMDDIWEELHGLDPNLNDAMLDSFGLGLPNIGVYRLGLNPQAVVPVQITAFSVTPPVLEWVTVTNGGIYQVEYSYDSWFIASNSWIPGPIYTSGVNGTLSVNSGLTLTNNVQYIRVKRLSP